ncbi:MAG TPA: hypothetical protein VF868_11710 [Bacteroidia bacterium]|jgi:hypothetical protein
MTEASNRKYSLLSVFFIFVFILSIFFSFNIWRKNRIIIDAPSYYTYLPAVFIHHDLSLGFIDKDPDFFRNVIWYYKIENGKKLIKHPMGISLALSPFFLAGHVAAKVTGGRQDGYSLCYQNAVSIGVLVYLAIGLLYLRKLLLVMFSDKITALTLVGLVIGTNLLWYSTIEGLMPHAISFSFICVCLFHFYECLRSGGAKNLFAFAFLFGLIILIRPLAITLLVYFITAAIVSKGGLKGFIAYLKPQWKYIIPAALIAVSIFSLQMFYLKYATGKWLYDVYIDEHFVFSSPQMLPFLFSFRKGIFIYTPVLIFSVIGLVWLYRKRRDVFYGTIIIMPLTVFLLSSWWAWSYGISWGIRPMIDYYALLAIPLAAGFSMSFSKGRILAGFSGVIIFLFIILNLFQTWQYKNGLIHYDDMTRESYFKGFFQTEKSLEWLDLLSPYDWDRRIRGLPQIEYNKEYIQASFGKYPVYLRGYNLQIVTVNAKAQHAVAAYMKAPGPGSWFDIEPSGEDIISFRAGNGYYLTVSGSYDNALIADAAFIGEKEKFHITYLSDNRVALKAWNGKYVAVSPDFPNILFASSSEVSQKETFRLFVKE